MTRRRSLARGADAPGRASCMAGLALLAAPIAAHAAPARTDPVPVIVTYEQRQARIETHQAVRDPRGFWIRQIVGRLESKKPALSSLKQPATVHVTFVVGHDGKLVSQTITRSSGNAVADHAALALVKAAGPFPPMPAAMSDSELTFSIPVRFR